jgi:hypothetical protein
MMWKDPIVEEIHQFREEHAKRFNYDLKAIFEDFKAQERHSSHLRATLPIKRKRPLTHSPVATASG